MDSFELTVTPVTLGITFALLLLPVLLFSMLGFGSKRKWNPNGLHIYITGGSQGLGLSAAIILAKKGANISIVARRKQPLDDALAQIEAVRVSPDQKFNAYSFPLGTYADSKAALEAACAPYGGIMPDCVLSCAGAATPRWWVDMTEEDMMKGMETGYWVQAWTAMIASQNMVKQRKTGGKIVFVSSIISYMAIPGYGSYAPPKTALRALGDALDSELQLYGIDVHNFFPPTMLTPGYEEELKTKPGPQKKIEEGDAPLSPDDAARAMIKGIEANQAHITGNFVTELFRASTRGSTKHHNLLWDATLDLIAFIAVPVWRWMTDKTILSFKDDHFKDLQARGHFKESSQSSSLS